MFQNVPGIYWAISALLTLSSGTKEKKCCCVLPFLRHFHTKQSQSGGQSAGRSPFQTPPVPQIRPNIFLSFFFFFYKFSTLIWKKTQVNRTGEKGETFICYSAGRSQSRAGRQRAAVGGAFSKYWNALLSGTPIFSPLPLVHSCCEGLTEIGKFVVTEWEAEMTS